jgi:hypothetical protein
MRTSARSSQKATHAERDERKRVKKVIYMKLSSGSHRSTSIESHAEVGNELTISDILDEQNHAVTAKKSDTPANPAAMGLRIRLPARPLMMTVWAWEEGLSPK